MSRRSSGIGVFAIAALLLLFPFYHFAKSSAAAQSTSPMPGGMSMGGGSQPATYMLSGGFWRTDGAFISTIRVKNVLIVGPMDVIPTLFMADGTPYVLPSVHIPTSGVATININDALAAAPPSVARHISSYGTAMLMWTYTSEGHVAASIASIDATRSLSFIFPFTVPMGNSMQQTVDGLWWRHDPDIQGFVAVSNTGDAATQASIQLVGPGVETQPAHTLSLAPHSTQLLRLEDLATNIAALAPRTGGVRVQYTGAMGSVQVVGGLENDTIGYSANIPFWLHDTSNSPPAPISYAFAGLMLGKPDPMMMPGFPKTTTFSPYLALRNTTEKPLDVSLQLNYMVGASPQTRTLPAQMLAPFEARQVDLHSALMAAGLKNFNGLIDMSASFTGKQGDLILASGSVDQTGTYVFEVGAQGIAKSRMKFSNYWTVADGNDTMITLWNPTSAAQDIVGTLYFGAGSGKYTVAIHLAPRASATIDIAMLIAQSKPDPNGIVFPPNVREGSAQFASPDGSRAWMNLVVASATYNVTIATCGENCIYCCGDSGFGINPSAFGLALGDTMACASTAVDCNGNILEPTWSSTSTSVMTVDGYGNVTGKSIGAADITATWYNAVMANGEQCFSGGQAFCATSSPTAQSGGSVFGITDVNPQTVIIGTSGTMDIGGGGLSGKGAPDVVFDGGGITASNATVVSDSEITVNFSVSCSAPIQNVYVTFPQFDNVTTNQLPVFTGFPNAPAPNIKFGGNNVGGTNQSVVVGQQIALTASVPSLPPCMSLSSQLWSTPPGTAVGGYTNNGSVTGGIPDTTGGHVVDISTVSRTGSSYTFYWAYPQNSMQMTYQYVMSGGGGQVTSPAATVTFNATWPGATMSNTPYPRVTIDSLQPCGGGTLGPAMVYGNIIGTLCTATYPGSTFGMVFNPSPTPSGGNFFYVQMINSDTRTENTINCSHSQGLDKAYPYQGIIPNTNPPEAEDAPGVGAPLPSGYVVQRSFNATMFLMWQSSTANSIPVPVGYQTWSFSGTAQETSPGNGNWQATTNGTPGPVGAFVPSNALQDTDGYTTLQFGYPTWSNVSTETCN